MSTSMNKKNPRVAETKENVLQLAQKLGGEKQDPKITDRKNTQGALKSCRGYFSTDDNADFQGKQTERKILKRKNRKSPLDEGGRGELCQ